MKTLPNQNTQNIKITQFEDKYTDDIIKLVLHFQNDGSRPFSTIDDQPDLLDIAKGGDFWIALDNGQLAGTIGIVPYTEDIAVMKKFFVYEKYQGEPTHLGRQLFDKLITFAKEHSIKSIILDTPTNTTRAHKFYEKAGFKLIAEDELPFKYHHPCPECHYFRLDL